MALSHVDEGVAIAIIEAYKAGKTYSQIKAEGIALSDNYISLVKREEKAGHISIGPDGKAVIHQFGTISRKNSDNDLSKGKKKENKLPTDKEFIAKTAGLDPGGKDPRETGTVDTSKIMETQTKFLTTQLQVAQGVGIFTVNMIREKAELTKEELDDPELQITRLTEYLKSSGILSQDPHALDRITAEYAYIKTAIQKAEHLLGVMQAGFDIASKVMCDDCRKQTFYALSLQAKGPPKPELTPEKSSQDKATEESK